MPSRRSGHFVQIWRPPHGGTRPVLVEVAGRKWHTTVNPESFAHYGGWTGVSRELSLRDAKRFAKEYARAGFPSRVTFLGNSGERKVVLELKPRRRKDR